METHTLDASNKSLGKLAVQVSILLRGKQKPNFVPYKDNGDFVLVKNFKQVKITGNKLEQKKYYHHSGYIGGLKEKPLSKLLQENPAEVLQKAVWGMLPKNKLRGEQIKRLKVEN